MPTHRRHRRLAPTPAHSRRLGAVGLSTALLAGLSAVLLPAQAQTTVTPSEPGPTPVVRGSSVTVNVDRAAMHYSRSSVSANYAQASASAVALTGCKGDNPAGTNASPRTVVTVKDPTGATILTSTSPARNIGLGGFLTTPTNQPLSPQPAPGNANYRGDFPGSTHHGFQATLDLAGKPAGVYTVTTTNSNTVKTGFGACSFATPVAVGSGFGTTSTPGPDVVETTFEYRPWATQFVDVFGKGGVRANIEPAEYEYSVDAQNSAIFAGDPVLAGTGRNQQFYGLSGGFPLPSDPAACMADPSSCLPSNATRCVPSSGCTPRIMFIDRPVRASDPNGLVGVFDLDTKAFVAYATINGTTRTLMSLGTANDAHYRDLLTKLAAGAATQGIDLTSILATQVNVGTGSKRISLSLLNGLQIDPSTAPGGVQISSDATVQAGIVLDIYSSLRLTGGACVANSASSSTEPERFTPKEDNGYTVKKSDLLPEVPGVGPLAAIVGGPLYHISGKFKSDALVNTATAVIGLDTAAGEPNGYPVWISPFLSGVNTAAPRTMDFLGTGTWSASESPVLSGCLVVDFLLGTGVAVHNNPLPVGLGTVFDPLATPTPAAERLTDALNDAVDDVIGQVTADPQVSSLLSQVTALLPLS
ncbi:hypothetical protein ASE01_11835 [Nocardioides sp. Root190]|uniref:hypothetical protein n=1 Tax=Nocardioides sp. Root190 TaxID=1736488 RepID=UPI0006FF17CD|nr:hypothetical protein [Nocardioides sp. Root190]KRB77400.1 hypothetical protein ASE01_11835 [Nocardioides sp. Root190]